MLTSDCLADIGECICLHDLPPTVENLGALVTSAIRAASPCAGFGPLAARSPATLESRPQIPDQIRSALCEPFVLSNRVWH
jgi:hypothetical protein